MKIVVGGREGDENAVFVWMFSCSMYKCSCIKFQLLIHAYMYINDDM